MNTYIHSTLLITLFSVSLLIAEKPASPSLKNRLKQTARYIPGIAKIALGAVGSVATHLLIIEGRNFTLKNYIKLFEKLIPSCDGQNTERIVTAAGLFAPTIMGAWLIKLGIQDCMNVYKKNNEKKTN